MLGLFIASKDVLTVSDFIGSFSDIKTYKQNFIYYCVMDTEIKDVSGLIMVTGFVVKKTITHRTCITCNSKQGYVGKPIDLFVDGQSKK